MVKTPPPFKILLVDDNEDNLLSLEALLSEPNRQFIKATSGNGALREIIRHDDIGLILLDVQMPEMDGFELAHMLKTSPRTRDISIIFVTAISKEHRYMLKGFDEGAVDYLYKPLDVEITKAKVAVFERLYFYQQQLKRSVIDLEKINRQLEKFVYIVAHDLKSPLSGIIALLTILKSDHNIRQDEETAEYVDLLSSAAHHLSDMVTSILEYSRQAINEQKIETVDVGELVSQTAFLLFPPKHIKIRAIPPLPIFSTRKLKLQQTFQNLISNAIKYNDKQNGLIEIGAADKGDYYEFFVRDNGPGIESNDKERVFRLFETTGNEATNGETSTGVGLNIAKMMTEEQGRNIWVESDPGKGSTFYFEWNKE